MTWDTRTGVVRHISLRRGASTFSLMGRKSRGRWELDPASSEDYVERLREYDAYRAGDRFRQWLAERLMPAQAAASTPRTVRPPSEARDS